MNIFGEPNLTPLYTDLEPFEIYRSISYNQEDSFLFESLDRPRRLAEITVMGFAPVSKIRGYSDYITVQRNNNNNTTTLSTADPCVALLEMMGTSTYDNYI
ncbi:MAG: anthranilate synthase component I, partial [Cenarchaeum sp. SB0673_bin_9]|nr:anthranilate synthase component I [Cenarchaeum sp. SB0673_bin_9]